jgi:sulfhydrogenase subunit gamma (sulfur reductase)
MADQAVCLPESIFHIPQEAEIIERIQESPTIFTLRLRFITADVQTAYTFRPGQFNMVYLYGVGEVPISIVSDPKDEHILDHTIRTVGRVTRALSHLKPGDRLGIRGPFGRGWPLEPAEGRDVVLITGGLGCAPLVSVINYIVLRRERFRKLTIMQGVKHSDDLIWREQYDRWAQLPETQVLLAAAEAEKGWRWHKGHVTVLFKHVTIDPAQTVSFICGPEPMILAAIHELKQRGVRDENIWMSMERNMQCATGHCGHCQIGGNFVCKNGPVFSYPELRGVLGVKGF